jgi:acetyl-CoA acyltransferase
MTVNRFCSSGLETIHLAALKVQSGTAECIIAGGCESMSMIPMGGNKFSPNPELAENRPGYYLGMGLTAERLAVEGNITREDQDAFSLRSHQQAVAAQEKGLFDDEIVPVSVDREIPSGNGPGTTREEILFEKDEGPRRDTSLEALGKLKPAFKQGGTVTAGNSSQMSDGAAALLVTSSEFAKQHGLTPLVRFVGYATAGLAPEVMGLGPVYAVPKVLDRTGLELGEMEIIELNEAFAAQALAVIRKLDLNLDKTNVNGGAIALGHPLGGTGAKLATQAIHELKRRAGRYAMVTMCIGGGMGAAGIFENLDNQ